jgi:soluble lytic murein transglycosylase-like protein
VWWLLVPVLFLLAGAGTGRKVRCPGAAISSAQARALSAKWGKVFGVPAPMVMTIMDRESNFNPSCVNTEAPGHGYAWGLMQLLLTTASDQVAKLRKSTYAKGAEVSATLKKWTSIPGDLLDPDLNAMLGTYYMRRIMDDYGFKDMAKLAAAYNHGPDGLKRYLAGGGNFASYDVAYVQPALAAYRRYA